MENVVTISACTLPTVAQPLRLHEFDSLLGTAVQSVERLGPLSVRLSLVPTPEVAASTANLLVRETACCSFFRFNLAATAGHLVLDVLVPEPYADVLHGLTSRIEELST